MLLTLLAFLPLLGWPHQWVADLKGTNDSSELGSRVGHRSRARAVWPAAVPTGQFWQMTSLLNERERVTERAGCAEIAHDFWSRCWDYHNCNCLERESNILEFNVDAFAILCCYSHANCYCWWVKIIQFVVPFPSRFKEGRSLTTGLQGWGLHFTLRGFTFRRLTSLLSCDLVDVCNLYMRGFQAKFMSLRA